VPHLKKQGTVPKSAASRYAFTAPYAQRLIYDVFEIGIFDKGALDRIHRTLLVFSGRIENLRVGAKIPAAEFTIPAHCICVNTLDR
jgi:hypothetical protein